MNKRKLTAFALVTMGLIPWQRDAADSPVLTKLKAIRAEQDAAFAKQDWAKAVKAADKLKDLPPYEKLPPGENDALSEEQGQYIDAIFGRGQAQNQLKKYKEAIPDFDFVIAHLPKPFGWAHFHRATALRKSGNSSAAFAELEKAAALMEGKEKAQMFLAVSWYHYEDQSYDTAIKKAEEAWALDSSNTMNLYNLGLYRLAKNDSRALVEYLRGLNAGFASNEENRLQIIKAAVKDIRESKAKIAESAQTRTALWLLLKALGDKARSDLLSKAVISAELRKALSDVAKITPELHYLVGAFFAMSGDKKLAEEQIIIVSLEDENFWKQAEKDPDYAPIFVSRGIGIDTKLKLEKDRPHLVLQQAHQSQIFSIRPLGRQRFLTTSKDLTAKIWDTNGRIISTLSGHFSRVVDSDYSESRKIIATAGDSVIYLWTLSGKPIRNFAFKSGQFLTIKFAGDGKYLLIGDTDRVILLNTETGEYEARQKIKGQVTGIAFTGKDYLIASTEYLKGKSHLYTGKINPRSGENLKIVPYMELDFTVDSAIHLPEKNMTVVGGYGKILLIQNGRKVSEKTLSLNNGRTSNVWLQNLDKSHFAFGTIDGLIGKVNIDPFAVVSQASIQPLWIENGYGRGRRNEHHVVEGILPINDANKIFVAGSNGCVYVRDFELRAIKSVCDKTIKISELIGGSWGVAMMRSDRNIQTISEFMLARSRLLETEKKKEFGAGNTDSHDRYLDLAELGSGGDDPVRERTQPDPAFVGLSSDQSKLFYLNQGYEETQYKKRSERLDIRQLKLDKAEDFPCTILQSDLCLTKDAFLEMKKSQNFEPVLDLQKYVERNHFVGNLILFRRLIAASDGSATLYTAGYESDRPTILQLNIREKRILGELQLEKGTAIRTLKKIGKKYFALLDNRTLIRLDENLSNKETCPVSQIMEIEQLNEEQILAANDFGRLVVIGTQNCKIIKEIPNYFGNTLGITKIENHVYVRAHDNIIRIINHQGTIVGALIVFIDGSGLVYTPDGRFDYTDRRALDYVSFRLGNTDKFIDLQDVHNKFRVKGLLKLVLSGKLPKLDKDYIGRAVQKRPQIKILAPETQNIVAAGEEKTKLYFRVKDTGGGVSEIRVQVGGIDLNPKFDQLTGDLEIEVPLNYGENLVRVAAYNKEGMPSDTSIELRREVPKKGIPKPNLYVLAVGINKYDQKPLNYAVKDAEAVVDAIRDNSQGIYDKTDFKVLKDDKAGRDDIIGAIEQIGAKAQANDVVFIYLSGHGFSTQKNAGGRLFYFLPYGFSWANMDSEDTARLQGLDAEKITELIQLQNLRAQKVILVIDACQSGDQLSAMASRSAADLEIAREQLERLANGTGRFLMTSAAGKELAREHPDVGHGLFTYVLLHALQGGEFKNPEGKKQSAQAAIDKDGFITVRSLGRYVEDNFQQQTKFYLEDTSQSPQASISLGRDSVSARANNDFPILRLKKK